MDTQYMEISDPIMSLSKIALYLESEDSNTSYMDFPKSGMMRSGNVYRGNFQEYIRDGESDGTYPNPELSEALMGFPTSWTETSV